ncbi:MAG TPA: neutral zinc metallopeptidase [Rhodothermia bacterium]
MRWKNAKKSTNVEDRRGSGAVRGTAKIGGGMVLIVFVVSLLLGQNPLEILGLLGGQSGAAGESAPGPPPDDESGEFVSVVLADMEDIWQQLFTGAGGQYVPAKLVLFSSAVESACGFNTAATGPFYCPPDQKVYLDLSFLGELQRLGASGDFALAYVIAHEVGHHVQNLVGTSESVRSGQSRAGSAESNRISVALELQADCYAGVWAHHSQKRGTISYDADDFQEGLRTASVIGDDYLQRQAGRRVQPESFTHGSSEQRASWLRRGLSTGDVEQCNTFE